MKTSEKRLISCFCLFKDRDAELLYESEFYARYKKILIPFFIILLAAIASVYLFDRYLHSHTLIPDFLWIRAVFTLLIVSGYFIFGRLKTARSYYITLNFTELSVTVLYILMLVLNKDDNFTNKCLEVVLLITFYLIFPNLWILSVLLSVLAVISFSIYCITSSRALTSMGDISFGIICILIIFVLLSINSFMLNYFKRSGYYETYLLKKMVNTDELTGAYTRAKFNKDIRKFIIRSRSSGSPFSIVIFDIDDFKHINDTYGHLAGDKILIKIVEIAAANKRTGDILTRWGGEEFALLLPETRCSFAVKFAERLRKAIADSDFGLGEKVTCSFGVTEFRIGDTQSTLFKRADNLLYTAKSVGKDTVITDIDEDQP